MDKNKKIAILVVLVIVAAVVWAPRGRKTSSGGAKDSLPSIQAAAAQAKPLQRKRTEFVDWGRDPFVWGGLGVSGLALSGIIWDEQAPYAIINGKIVHPGDEISGKTVKSIEPTQVILTDGSKDYPLNLK